MKVFIVAREKKVIQGYKRILEKLGFEYSKANPEVILSLGGDGTYLIAEHAYPEVPKLLIRDAHICNKVSPAHFTNIVKNLKDKSMYKISEWIKIECNFRKNAMVAANDVIIRNKDQRQAIRFRIMVDSIPIRHEYIGDGVVLSTPWGASGYFHTITKKMFKKGIGIALNNTNTERRDIIIKEDSKIEVLITRGNAVLSVDNARKEFILKTGDKVAIKKHKRDANIIQIRNK